MSNAINVSVAAAQAAVQDIETIVIPEHDFAWESHMDLLLSETPQEVT